MVRVKICGITRLADLRAAVAAGADAVGFNFHRPSPRYVTPGAARRLARALPPLVTPVGVFHGESGPAMRAAIARSGVRLAQVPGSTPARVARALGVPVMRVYRVRQRADAVAAGRARAALVMLDAYRAGAGGGTGRVFPWKLALGARFRSPMVLAGGLTPANVGRAVRTVGPFGVDVASGVESRPGVKDHGKIRRFVRAAKAAG